MAWEIWGFFGVMLIAFELLSPTFFAGFVGIGFLVAAFVSYGMPEETFLQISAALMGAIIGYVLLIKKRSGNEGDTWTGQAHHGIGQKGIALTLLTSHDEGKVELDEPFEGEKFWDARSDKGEILEGSAVKIVEIKSSSIVVEALF